MSKKGIEKHTKLSKGMNNGCMFLLSQSSSPRASVGILVEVGIVCGRMIKTEV